MIDTVKARAQQRVGTTVGKYKIDALLGVGGMAAVFAGTHQNLNRAALKVLHRELCDVGEIRRRFVQEGYVANRIGHNAVVRVIDDDVDADGCPYLVMELLDGTTLETLRESGGGKLTPSEAVSLVCALLDVLEAAHRAGVVHRDVKPENVFLTRDGYVKLMDFGIARLLDGSNKTNTGALMGTPAFMAPEQAGGRTKDIDRRTDVWSVGALLFMLLTGEEVHPAPSAQLQMIYGATQPARSIKKVAPRLHDDVAHVVDVALAFDRDSRWQTADAMKNALTNAANAMSLEVAVTVRPRLELVPNNGEPRAQTTLVMGSGSGGSST